MHVFINSAACHVLARASPSLYSCGNRPVGAWYRVVSHNCVPPSLFRIAAVAALTGVAVALISDGLSASLTSHALHFLASAAPVYPPLPFLRAFQAWICIPVAVSVLKVSSLCRSRAVFTVPLPHVRWSTRDESFDASVNGAILRGIRGSPTLRPGLLAAVVKSSQLLGHCRDSGACHGLLVLPA